VTRARPEELLEVCPNCGAAELRRDSTTGDLDCVACGGLVEAGPYGVLDLEDEEGDS
jgi:uncharacterized protein (DUF983 family)